MRKAHVLTVAKAGVEAMAGGRLARHDGLAAFVYSIADYAQFLAPELRGHTRETKEELAAEAFDFARGWGLFWIGAG